MAGLNRWSLNSVPLNSAGIVIVATGSGLIVSAEQNVLVLGSGLIVSVEQNVELRITGVGLIVSVEQTLIATASGLVVSVEQNVTDSTANTFYLRNQYDVDIFIGGYLVPKAQIHGSVIVSKQEGTASSCAFTIIPAAGTQDIEALQGRSVVVDIRQSSGKSRIFTGYVDLPDVDIIDKKITFACTDRRTTSLNNLNRAVVDSVGSYSEHVFGVAKDQAAEVAARLQTVPSSIDFDNYGVATLTSWTPKETPDFTLYGSDIYYDTPRVVYTNRTQTINTINLKMNYTFSRLHQQVVNINWTGFQSFCTSWFESGRPSFPTKENILSAAQSGNWKPTSNITFTDIWDAQGFNCSTGAVTWQPNQIVYDYKARTKSIFLVAPDGSTTWPDGNQYPIDTFILDAAGNKIYDIVRTTITDTSSQLCRGAFWSTATKFAQNITEEFNIQLKSPQAVSRFGTIQEEQVVDVRAEFDTTKWENTDNGVYFTDYSFYVNERTDYTEFVKSMGVAINKARTAILAAHRDVTVEFRRGLWPQIDLHHTVETLATQIQTRSKVYAITHTIDVTTGEASTRVELKLSRAAALDANDVVRVLLPQIEDPSYIGILPTVNLATHTGIDPDPEVTPGAELWNGWVGNADVTSDLYGQRRTEYPEAFIVDYPAIPDIVRKDRTMVDDYTFNISVPNDELTVVF